MNKKILSIQSHVSHGYVGGKAAIFPLQTQGWEVDNINTVSFSNHTGYGSFKGPAMGNDDLRNILQGLEELQLNYDAILTGYMPNAGQISIVNSYIKRSKVQNPDLLYLLDPVMGDEGYLYVDESCITEYRRILRDKIVDIITPNQFELELICDMKISNTEDLKNAIDYLHNECDIKYVVISSLSQDLNLCSDTGDKDLIYCAISTSFSQNNVQVFQIPVIKSYFTGIGDLFSALLLDKLYNNLTLGNDPIKSLSRSVNQVLTVMKKVLELTHRSGLEAYCSANGLVFTEDLALSGKINDADTMKFFELRIIQAKQFYGYEGEGDLQLVPI